MDLCQPITSSEARGLMNPGQPITSSEMRGLMDLGQPINSSEARGLIDLDPLASLEVRGWERLILPPALLELVG